MNIRSRKFAAALLAASLSMSPLPAFAQDEASADSQETSQAVSETPSVQADSSTVSSPEESSSEKSESPAEDSSEKDSSEKDSSKKDSSDKNSSAENSDDVMPAVDPDGQNAERQNKTDPESSVNSSADNSSGSSSGSSEEKKDETIDYSEPVFNATDNTLTCKFTLKEVPSALAFQVIWTNDAHVVDDGASLDPTPVSVKCGDTDLSTDIKAKSGPVDSTSSNASRMTQLTYTFTSDQLKALNSGDEIEFVFQAYPGSVNSKVLTTSQVYIGEDGSTDATSKAQERSFDFAVASEWKAINYEYDPEAKTWTFSLEAREKPEALSIYFVSTPSDFLQTSGAAVTVDGKQITDAKIEAVDPSASSEVSNQVGSDDSSSDAIKKGIRVTFPTSAIEAMTDSSKIDVTFKTSASSLQQASVIADVNNGKHPVTYETGDFEVGGLPVTGHSYDKANQTWTANVTLQRKPKELVLTFTQLNGSCLGNVKTVKIGDKEVKPDIKESTEGGKKVYTLTFSTDQVNEMEPKTKVSVAFGINPPSSGSTTEKIEMNVKDGYIDKNYTASFTVEKAKAPAASGASTAAETGLYTMIGIFAAALIAFGAFFFISKKKKKS